MHHIPTERLSVTNSKLPKGLQLWTRELLAPVDMLQSAGLCMELNTKDKVGAISDTSKLPGTKELSNALEK